MTLESDNNEFGFYEGECQGCDIFTRVDYVGLCEDCAAKLDRDLVRQRDWKYSKVAYAIPLEKREDLRKKVIQQYGADLELIATYKTTKSKSKHKKRKKKETLKIET